MALEMDRCWKAVVERDRSQDGRFFYGVVTTGVYCRPACTSRRPKRDNVRFYESPEAAEADGLRACRRCHPRSLPSDAPTVVRMRRLCAYIDHHLDERLTLADLSRRAKMSPAHLQRSFTAIVGVSPKQYLDARRLSALKTHLRDAKEPEVTGSIFGAGYGSISRVYENVNRRFGMTPMAYRQGGRGVEISWVVKDTPLGLMMVGATDRGVCFVQFGASRRALLTALETEYPEARLTESASPNNPQVQAWMDALNRYLVGAVSNPDLPIHVRATVFQTKVWQYLQSVPTGKTVTYREVAQAIGQPDGARAVARACASNHVALVIPCHRVIRASGELGGYKWGLERKRALLERERRGGALETATDVSA